MRHIESRPAFRNVARFAALILGCNPPPPSDPGAPHFVVADVIVSVTNQGPRELQIYVGTAALARVLGPVPGHSTRSFSLPSRLGDSTRPLHFEARERRNSSGLRSGTFNISPGEQVRWSIGEHGSEVVTKR